MPTKNPPHPGELIRTEVIEALGLTVSKAAEVLQVRRATLSDLLHGKAALTPDMALRIEKAFGPDMDHLLRMQLAYDVARTRQRARNISIKRYAPA
jgi:addiction module HigA family antidote